VVLALGYGGAVGALGKMAKGYGVRIPDPDGVVQRWRRANPWVADRKFGWWARLHEAAMCAMEGDEHRAGRVSLQMAGANLVLLLPSGRTVHYPLAKVVEGDYGAEVQYLKAAWKPKAKAKEWPTARLWHGVLAENADQAICADLLRETLVRAEKDGIEVIGHVHDEVITESDPKTAQARGRALGRCMVKLPKWAAGFPVKAEVDISARFRK
jgi:DNA polymerase